MRNDESIENDYVIISNREIIIQFNDSNIVTTLKSQRLRWVGHICRAEG